MQVVATQENHLLGLTEAEDIHALMNDIFVKARMSTLPFPLTTNRIVTAPLPKTEIIENADSAYPIAHSKIKQLLHGFLQFKKENGSSIEKTLYADMNEMALFDRLICKRPLAFYTAGDKYTLRDYPYNQGYGGFDKIGTTEQSRLTLAKYMSYDEMALAALVGVSVPTHFINAGGRRNDGKVAEEGTYERCGVYVGLVGARFERKNLMEWRHMIITQEQNTSDNGYGDYTDINNVKYQALQPWKQFYGLQYNFPSYEEAKNQYQMESAIQKQDFTFEEFKIYGNSVYFNCQVFRERMRAVLEPFLIDANQRANIKKKQAYVHLVGLGLGAWALDAKNPLQGKLLVQAVAEILRSNTLSDIADIDFSWFPSECTQCGGVSNGQLFNENNNSIKMHFSKRDPAAKLDDNDAGKLLVAAFAWDGNSFPGNEYWDGALHASGDPAAMACSYVAELGNPLINHKISARHRRLLPHVAAGD